MSDSDKGASIDDLDSVDTNDIAVVVGDIMVRMEGLELSPDRSGVSMQGTVLHIPSGQKMELNAYSMSSLAYAMHSAGKVVAIRHTELLTEARDKEQEKFTIKAEGPIH